MRALAYLLGARALDVPRDTESGIRWPKPEVELLPIATTEETAVAWRRWRAAGSIDAEPRQRTAATRALTPSAI